MAIHKTSAALRIFGPNLDFGRITRELGTLPTHTHRAGDLNRLGRPFEHDMWSLDSRLGQQASLDEHLKWLHQTLSPHYEFLRSMKHVAAVDVFLSYLSAEDQAGFEISPEAFRIFSELGIPFGVSAILGLGED